jgi:hypothetical protein
MKTGIIKNPGHFLHNARVKLIRRQVSGDSMVEFLEPRQCYGIGDQVQVGTGEYRPDDQAMSGGARMRRFWEALELYTGKKIVNVQMYPDPQVPGAVALRGLYVEEPKDSNDYVECLVKGFSGQDAEWVSENVEECEFRSWPPTSST